MTDKQAAVKLRLMLHKRSAWHDMMEAGEREAIERAIGALETRAARDSKTDSHVLKTGPHGEAVR